MIKLKFLVVNLMILLLLNSKLIYASQDESLIGLEPVDINSKYLNQEDFKNEQIKNESSKEIVFSGQMIKIAYNPLVVNADLNNRSWYLKEGALVLEGDDLVVDYSNYSDLSNGGLYSLALGVFGDTYLEVGADYYKLEEDIAGLGFNVAGGWKKSILNNLSLYYGLSGGSGKFKLYLAEDRIIRELTGDQINTLEKRFLNLSGQVGLEARIKDLILFTQFDISQFFFTSDWYYEQESDNWLPEQFQDDDQLISIEDKYLPYSALEIDNFSLKFGLALVF